MIARHEEFTQLAHRKDSRLAWVDWMKGMAILMVVFGHTPILKETDCTRFFYAFHVPLFFILSGALQRSLPMETKFWSFLKAKARRLLLPYLGFAVGSFVIWFFLRTHLRNASLNVSPAQAALSYLQGQPEFNPPLWFFLSLFVSELLAFPFFKPALTLMGVIRSTLLMAALLFASSKGYGAIWGILGACLGMPFLIAGHKFFRLLDQLSKRRSLLLLLSFPLLGLTLYTSQLNGLVGMRNGVCGNLMLFYVSAFAGFLWVLTTVPAAPFVKPMLALGRASAAIFAMHYVIGIFVMHGGSQLSTRMGVTQRPALVLFWLVVWLFWSAAAWLGYEGFMRAKKRVGVLFSSPGTRDTSSVQA